MDLILIGTAFISLFIREYKDKILEMRIIENKNGVLFWVLEAPLYPVKKLFKN